MYRESGPRILRGSERRPRLLHVGVERRRFVHAEVGQCVPCLPQITSEQRRIARAAPATGEILRNGVADELRLANATCFCDVVERPREFDRQPKGEVGIIHVLHNDTTVIQTQYVVVQEDACEVLCMTKVQRLA